MRRSVRGDGEGGLRRRSGSALPTRRPGWRLSSPKPENAFAFSVLVSGA